MFRKIVFACAVLYGCSGGTDVQYSGNNRTLSLTGDPAIDSVFLDWRDRWYEASGVQVSFGNGAQIYDSDSMLNDQGDCGETVFAGGRLIRVVIGNSNPSCAGLRVVVGHELGHVVASSGEHATTGILEPTSDQGPQIITAESLQAVCDTAPCTVFNPEN